ncbi:hypothetical protein GF385_01730 [Candidatus Dependentiae bacterium]|nr:hypothetical protein [Candidatus Dependentiae bacterium]
MKKQVNNKDENKRVKSNKKKYTIITIISLIIALSSSIIFKHYRSFGFFSKKENHITVFTHGSFGSVIGLMNLFHVIKDKITGTKYKRTISRMRKDPNFYSSQPIMQKGLFKIKPSFDLATTSSARFAAYPILKSYEEINKQFQAENIRDHFYTFGWSGLISQERRRIEAIRFYNALSEELEKYNQSQKLKVKILAHSHGGNMALNLCAVNAVINNFENIKPLLEQATTDDEREALKLMYKQIKKLPTKEKNINKKGQKRFDYIPTNKNLKINELLMFGTPIQPETECFIFHNFFKKIYNIYSEEDVVQDMDIFSTKKYSSQRLRILEEITPNKNIPKIIQLKIMVDRDMKKIIKDEIKTLTLVQTNTQQTSEAKNQSFWKKLFSRNRFGPKKTKDPTHREMWFVSWDKLKKNLKTSLESIPSVIFTPLFLNAIEKISEQTNDIDVNIRLTNKNLKVYVFKHSLEEQKVEYKVSMERNIVDSIKTKLLKWIPDDLSFSNKFNIIKTYQEQI